jgi:thiol-disulfide isomerase/thioredoxin
MRLREVPMSPLLLVAAALAASPSKKEQIETLEAQARSLNEQLAALTVSLQEELAAKEAARAEVTAAHVAAAKEVSRVRDGLLDIATELQKLEAELARPLKKGEKRDLEPLLRQVRDLQASVAAFDAGSAEKFSQEVDASAVVGKLKAAMAAGDFNQAMAAAELLNGPYRDTEAAGSAKRYLAELSTIGLHPAEPVVLQWFTSPASVRDQPLTILVFWETWCPHCTRVVPALSQWTETYGKRGLQVIALTRITKTASPETVKAFIAEHKLPFAVAQEDGAYAELLQVTGIPAAAIVVNGEVVWRGHPARIDAALLERWIQK